jgi:hypothetical protein
MAPSVISAADVEKALRYWAGLLGLRGGRQIHALNDVRERMAFWDMDTVDREVLTLEQQSAYAKFSERRSLLEHEVGQ